jgi:type IV pilus assembly protein PilN
MIRINLLPVREARRKATLHQQFIVLGLTLGIALGVSWLIHAAVLRKISVTEQRISQLNQQIEGHKPQQARVEEFKKKKADIRSKLDVIQELELSRAGPVRLLDELATHIPERVWLTDLSARNGQLEINGMSLDNELIASFLTALSDSPYFENVELESTQLKEVKKLKLNSFRIRAALRTPREAGGEADPGAPRAAGVAG